MATRARRPLAEYDLKRDFARTSEPSGKPRKAGAKKTAKKTMKKTSKKAVKKTMKKSVKRNPIFVVQHHKASHDHHDFRLEHNGVLLSWAVPKHVSTKVGDRRLAVQVEDHPLDYATFEGTIPEGNYGAGTVKTWDSGHFEPEGDVDEGLQEGKISFTLFGERLTGDWTLVRMRPREGEKSRKPQWLLMRHRLKKSQ